jgi:hypothetical protein
MINQVGVINVARQCYEENPGFTQVPTWGLNPGLSFMTGSKRVEHWTSGTVCECSEIAGSPQYSRILMFYGLDSEIFLISVPY